MVLHVLCVLLSLSVTVVSSTCCLPKQWEAMEIYLIGSYYNGSTITTRGSANASFDSLKKKIAYSFETSSSRGYFSKGFTIQDYNTKIQYDISDDKCVKSKIYDPFPSVCVPSNATEELKSFVAFGETHAPTTRYSIPYGNEAHVTVLEKTCTPLSYQILGNIEGAESVKAADVYGFSMGIRKPSIFDVPSICNTTVEAYVNRRNHKFHVSWFSPLSGFKPRYAKQIFQK